MKNLIIVGGTAGVGKTTTCRELQKILPRNVFLDGDWCWDMRPFLVTGETKKMVESNIAHLLNNFLDCSEFENVIFCWVLHQQKSHRRLLTNQLRQRLRNSQLILKPTKNLMRLLL